jgi:hypothetical protein
MLKKVFGNCPQVKVLDFLLSSLNKYFNKIQIANGSNISRPTLNNFIEDFIEFNLLKKTNTGYELNVESDIIKYLAKVNFLLVDVELTLEKENYKYKTDLEEDLDDWIDDAFDNDLEYNELIENTEEILVNKKEYYKLKEFYIRNNNLVKYLMKNSKSNELNFKKDFERSGAIISK